MNAAIWQLAVMNFFIVRGINYYWNYLFGSIYCNYNYVELNYDLCFMCLKSYILLKCR